jgi:hypothetical protein
MIAILSALVSLLSFRFRSRASLELELVALRHQVIVLRRHRPRRLQLHSADRLLWAWLYRVCPRVLGAMVLVKPATVVKWHRQGFRIYWRWRSRYPGRCACGKFKLGHIGDGVRPRSARTARALPSGLHAESVRPRLAIGAYEIRYNITAVRLNIEEIQLVSGRQG